MNKLHFNSQTKNTPLSVSGFIHHNTKNIWRQCYRVGIEPTYVLRFPRRLRPVAQLTHIVMLAAKIKYVLVVGRIG